MSIEKPIFNCLVVARAQKTALADEVHDDKLARRLCHCPSCRVSTNPIQDKRRSIPMEKLRWGLQKPEYRVNGLKSFDNPIYSAIILI